MFQKRFFVAVIVSTFLWLLTGCGEPTLNDAARGLNASPALWKVSKNDKEIYLFGSVHILPPQIRWYTPTIRSAFESSDVIVVESLQTDRNSLRPLFVKYAFLPQGHVIEEYLTKEEYRKYLGIAKEAGIDTYYANRMRPWFFLATVEARMLQPMRAYGVDHLFIEAAKHQGKRLVALESDEEILQTVSRIPLAKDIARLKTILSQAKKIQHDATDRKKAAEEAAEMMMAWALGDVQRLKRLFRKRMPKATYRHVIAARNRMWFERLLRLSASHRRVFVIVGAGHLLGKEGLTEMFRRRGFRVERLQ